MFTEWSLRKRLIITTAVLTAMAGLAIGMANLVGVRTFMIGQLDEDLVQAAERLQNPRENHAVGDDFGNQINGAGTAVGTVLAAFDAQGNVSAVYLNADANQRTFDDAQLNSIPTTGWTTEIREVRIDDSGNYRMAVVGTTEGSTILLGLPTATVDRVVSRIALFQLFLIVGVVGLVVLAGRKGVDMALRPLERMRETARRVSGMPLAAGEVALTERVQIDEPETEVGQLGEAFNQMLDHVDEALKSRQESEAKVRQFVSDASHELRTPLTAIRGYSELTRRTNMEMSPELAYALERIESESIRMTALVEDLLLLARLDEGRELDLVETDLSTIVRNAVADAETAGPDHTWSVDAAENVTVHGDQHRLHQIVANVLGNARVHTPAGTQVSTTLSVVDGMATLSIVDNGLGVPGEIMDSLFERFTRADGSRNRATGSTGLGLAIVEGLVRAHHGTIAAHSAEGRTEFRITLPVAD